MCFFESKVQGFPKEAYKIQQNYSQALKIEMSNSGDSEVNWDELSAEEIDALLAKEDDNEAPCVEELQYAATNYNQSDNDFKENEVKILIVFNVHFLCKFSFFFSLVFYCLCFLFFS